MEIDFLNRENYPNILNELFEKKMISDKSIYYIKDLIKDESLDLLGFSQILGKGGCFDEITGDFKNDSSVNFQIKIEFSSRVKKETFYIIDYWNSDKTIKYF